jgi:hypothetical protein
VVEVASKKAWAPRNTSQSLIVREGKAIDVGEGGRTTHRVDSQIGKRTRNFIIKSGEIFAFIDW